MESLNLREGQSYPRAGFIRRVAIGGVATGAFVTGARTIGALAVGAFAVGRFAIRRLVIRDVRIRKLEVGELRVSQIQTPKFPVPETGLFMTHFLTVADTKRSARFYSQVFGGETVYEGGPTIVKVANSWMILNVGGGPTDDKPETVLHPPTTSKEVSSFLNIRVSNMDRYYREWKKQGIEFLTEPKIHETEIRCYMKDPDGYLIEIGQSTALASALKKAA